MKKINIVKKNEDFARIIKENNSYNLKQFIIFVDNNYSGVYQFGISVSKKIGNAVTRNKIKRQIKNIIDKKDYKNDFKCIIIIRKNFLLNTFSQNESDLINVFKKFHLLKEDN